MNSRAFTAKELESIIQNYLAFRKVEGSEQIASVLSQINLAESLIRFTPKVIYEHGGGLGTLTKLTKSILPTSQIITFERNPYCQSALSNLNLSDVTLVDNVPRKGFDGIIIDDCLSRFQLFQLLKSKSRLKFVFIEGKRNSTVRDVALIFLLLGKKNFWYSKGVNPEYILNILNGSSVLQEIKNEGKKGLFHPKLKSGSSFIYIENRTIKRTLKNVFSLWRVVISR